MAGNTFALDISRFVQKAKGKEDLVVRKVALDMFRRVIFRTPVDTGRARANWQASIGKAIENQSSVFAPALGSKGGHTQPQRKKHGGQAGAKAVAGANAVVAKAKAGDKIFLANNVAYIVALEHGHSKQAPAGMVGITVQEFGAVVNSAASQAKASK